MTMVTAILFRLSTYFDLNRRCKMQNDERDVLAILEFDLREETIGVWLRCIMQRLEEKRRAIGVTLGFDQALDVTRAELVAGGRSTPLVLDPK
jgi:hypothetical protein